MQRDRGGRVEHQDARRAVHEPHRPALQHAAPAAQERIELAQNGDLHAGAAAQIVAELELGFHARLAVFDPLLVVGIAEQALGIFQRQRLVLAAALGEHVGIERRMGAHAIEMRLHDRVEIGPEDFPDLGAQRERLGVDAVEAEAYLVCGGNRHGLPAQEIGPRLLGIVNAGGTAHLGQEGLAGPEGRQQAPSLMEQSGWRAAQVARASLRLLARETLQVEVEIGSIKNEQRAQNW